MKTKILLGALLFALMIPAASAAHSITITNANDISTGTFTARVDVENFNLRDFSGQSGQTKGSGHIHYLVNGIDACTAGKGQNCDSNPAAYATASKTFTYANLEKGDVIQAELVLDDHTGSGTDSSGNLNGQRVLSQEVSVGGSMSTPGVGPLAMIAGLGALAFLRRK